MRLPAAFCQHAGVVPSASDWQGEHITAALRECELLPSQVHALAKVALAQEVAGRVQSNTSAAALTPENLVKPFAHSDASPIPVPGHRNPQDAVRRAAHR